MTGAAPSGVVTFLFTDVEGSTRRWESDADAMRVALVASQHLGLLISNQTTYATRADQLLGQAISQVGVSQKFVLEIPVSSSAFRHL